MMMLSANGDVGLCSEGCLPVPRGQPFRQCGACKDVQLMVQSGIRRICTAVWVQNRIKHDTGDLTAEDELRLRNFKCTPHGQASVAIYEAEELAVIKADVDRFFEHRKWLARWQVLLGKCT